MEPSSVSVHSITLSDLLASCLMCSATLMVQGLDLLIDFCLLSSQLPLCHTKVLIHAQLLKLLLNIIELMLQRLNEHFVSPGLGP